MSSHTSTPTTLHTSSTPSNRPLADFFSVTPSATSSRYSQPESHYVKYSKPRERSNFSVKTLIEEETVVTPSLNRASTASTSKNAHPFGAEAFNNPRPTPPLPFVIPGDHDLKRSQSSRVAQSSAQATRAPAPTNTQTGLSRTLSTTLRSGLRRLTSTHGRGPSIEKSTIRSPTGFRADSRAYANGVPMDVANAIPIAEAQRRRAELGDQAFVRTAATARPVGVTRSQSVSKAASEQKIPRSGNSNASKKQAIPPALPAPAHVPAPAPTAKQSRRLSNASGMTTWTQFVDAGFASSPIPSTKSHSNVESWNTINILNHNLTPRTIPEKSSMLPLPLNTSKALPEEPNPAPPHNSIARARRCSCDATCMEDLYDGCVRIPDRPVSPPASVVEAIAQATRLRKADNEGEDEEDWSWSGSSIATHIPPTNQQLYHPNNETSVRASDVDEVRRLYNLKFGRPGTAGSEESEGDTTVDHRLHGSHVSILVTSYPNNDTIKSVHRRVPLPDAAGRVWEGLEVEREGWGGVVRRESVRKERQARSRVQSSA
ncbi:hypothetical protein LTR78_007334 [Recurvomyces mirabilis]|uniref:Uncharacterized protein n=1 Tax=Recurvomyces mirabilis TaxID=574656 RepID=A0AAE0TS30_9PEZI|nr:hypothetical protein LTR78_007334 [Recurvomyces mirabilis]KAK5155079.1 hypothetical protein LTS14_006034 [Recurvomyces mirabilis]